MSLYTFEEIDHVYPIVGYEQIECVVEMTIAIEPDTVLDSRYPEGVAYRPSGYVDSWRVKSCKCMDDAGTEVDPDAVHDEIQAAVSDLDIQWYVDKHLERQGEAY